MQTGRLGAHVPSSGETFQALVTLRGSRIEHIVSSDLPDTRMQSQDWDEWVLLMAGQASVEVDGVVVEMRAGDWLVIPAWTEHRVRSTSRGASWLAVHGGSD